MKFSWIHGEIRNRGQCREFFLDSNLLFKQLYFILKNMSFLTFYFKKNLSEIMKTEESGSLFLMSTFEEIKAALWEFSCPPFLKGTGDHFPAHETHKSGKNCLPWLCTSQPFSLEHLCYDTRLCYPASLRTHKNASIYAMVFRFLMSFFPLKKVMPILILKSNLKIQYLTRGVICTLAT